MDSTVRPVMDAIRRIQTEWNKIKPGKNKSGSVYGLWAEAREMKTYLDQKRREIEAEYQGLSKKLSPSFLQSQRRELDKEYDQAVEEIRDGFRKDIQAFVDSKTEKLDTMLVTAPAPEQRDLLSALQMRGRNVTKAEMFRIMPVFYNNYNSLKAFEQICRDAGQTVHIPVADSMEMYAGLEELQSYFLKITGEIGKPVVDAQYRPFFYTEPENPLITADPNVTRFSNLFDNVEQLQDDSLKLTYAEEAKARALFSSVESLDPEKPMDQIKIANLTDQILRDHPEDIALILRSDYAPYAKMALDLKQAKLDAKAAEALSEENRKEQAS